jgi:hypothetical protein
LETVQQLGQQNGHMLGAHTRPGERRIRSASP